MGGVAAAKQLGHGKRVVTVICDSGLKYLDTDLYTNEALPPG